MSAQSEPASAEQVVARLERLSVWSLPYLYLGIIGVGFLFTFYDIFDINVSFIQTCMQIVPSCKPETAASFIGVPVLLNLAGYVIGTLVLSPIADTAGRRNLLLVTMLITGLGSLLNAFVADYSWFNVARFITGIGIGADLAVVNVYVNEMAPTKERARYTSAVFTFSAVGAVLGIWLGLFLTTPATPFPIGLPFAVAGAHFSEGWRIMYVVGALLAVVGIVMRVQLPESPRWLLSRGRRAEAAAVVGQMERHASVRGKLAEPRLEGVRVEAEARYGMTYAEIFSNPTYLKRTLILFVVWFLAYVTVYGFAAGFTSVLSASGYPPPEAGLITAFGTIGFVLCALTATWLGEHLERKLWMPIAAVVTIAGGVLLALSGEHFGLSILGSVIVFFGFNLWVPLAYSWSTENYPARARTTGFALVDGVGHLGGGIGLILIAPLIPHIGPLGSMLLISVFLLIAAIVAQGGVRTRGMPLHEISP